MTTFTLTYAPTTQTTPSASDVFVKTSTAAAAAAGNEYTVDKTGILIISMSSVLETDGSTTSTGIGLVLTVYKNGVAAGDQVLDVNTNSVHSESESRNYSPDFHNLSMTKIIKVTKDDKIYFGVEINGTLSRIVFAKTPDAGTGTGGNSGTGPGEGGLARQTFIQINCINI